MAQRHKLPFVLAASDHGAMIVSRFDWRKETPDSAIGVGIEILEHGAYQRDEVDMLLGLLTLRRQYFGPGVLAIDGGANIGVHTVEWARAMQGWGQVVAVEPQERIFYALAGNIALGNLFNACAIHAALSDADGHMAIPVPDYEQPGNYGGLSLAPEQQNDIGQELTDTAQVRMLRIDSLGLPRLDLIKLDIEGMEMQALAGAQASIADYRPILMVECITLDSGTKKDARQSAEPVLEFMRERDYEPFRFGQNLVCVHRLDKTLDHVRHLHRTLLRQQAGVDNMNVEWTKFENKEVA